jgi:hypothetical protein
MLTLTEERNRNNKSVVSSWVSGSHIGTYTSRKCFATTDDKDYRKPFAQEQIAKKLVTFPATTAPTTCTIVRIAWSIAIVSCPFIGSGCVPNFILSVT